MQMRRPSVSINVTHTDLLHGRLLLLEIAWLMSLDTVVVCQLPIYLCPCISQHTTDHVSSIAKTACQIC